MQIQKLECQNLWIHQRGEHRRERQQLSQLLTIEAETAEAEGADPGADTFIGDRSRSWSVPRTTKDEQRDPHLEPLVVVTDLDL